MTDTRCPLSLNTTTHGKHHVVPHQPPADFRGGSTVCDADGRFLFQEKWEGRYMFVLQGLKPVCLLCYEAVSAKKEFNILNMPDSLSGKTKKSPRIKRKTTMAAMCS